MRLGLRLKKVLSLVDVGAECVFDVGTDHGYLTLALICKNKVKRVVASDISANSLKKAQTLVKEYNIENQVHFYVSDGLESFPEDLGADFVVIAGMGENEIIKILSNIKDFANYKNFILQPMQGAEYLRKYLFEAGFEINYDETILDKNKFYSVIKTRKVNFKTNYIEKDLWFGKTDLEKLGEDFVGFVSYLKRGLELKKEHLSECELDKLNECENILKIKKKR